MQYFDESSTERHMLSFHNRTNPPPQLLLGTVHLFLKSKLRKA